MSFILDALKKSEHERQRQATPGLVGSAVVHPRQRLPSWAIALCVLLGINLLVLLAVLLRGAMTPGATAPGVSTPGSTASHAPGLEAAKPAATTSQSAPTRPFSPVDPQPVYAPEIPLAAEPADAGQAQAQTAPEQAPEAPPARVRRKDPVLTEDDSNARADEALPSINEINLTGAQALPDLHLDVHVFSTKAADRFVFINMRKYHEGATLEEGPTVERIRRDGVVLDYQGLRFLLPRH